MSTSETGSQQAGELILHEISLMDSQKGSKMNIKGFMLELNLYEDLFNHVMTGSVLVSEGFSLRSNLPMLGEEYLYLRYSSPINPSKIISKIFYIFKIADVVIIDKSENYHLHFVSVEALTDVSAKVSKGYQGKSNTIITDIFKEYFKASEKQVVIGAEPSNNIKFVSNFWSPFKIINYATAAAVDSSRGQLPTYLFYEDTEQFNFVTLNSLMEKAPKTEYFYDAANPKRLQDDLGSTRDIEREYKTISKVHIDSHSDFIQRIMDGIYKARVYEYDLFRRTLNKHEYSYFDSFDKVPHLEKNPVQAETTRNGEGLIDYRITYPYLHDSLKQDRAAYILANRPGMLGATTIFKMDIVVPGRADLKVGDTVNVNMLQHESFGSKVEHSSGTLDPYLSGKYLISAIQHRITQTRHEMVCQLFKDSYVSKIDFSRKPT